MGGACADRVRVMRCPRAALFACAVLAAPARADRLEKLVELVKNRWEKDNVTGAVEAPDPAAGAQDAAELEERKRRADERVRELRAKLATGTPGPSAARPAPAPPDKDPAAAPAAQQAAAGCDGQRRQLAPVSCKKHSTTGWNYRCEVIYPGVGSQGLVGGSWGKLDLSFDYGAPTTVVGVFTDNKIELEVHHGPSMDGPWQLHEAVKVDGDAIFSKGALQTRYLRLLWPRSPRLPGQLGVHAAALGCGGITEAPAADAPDATEPPTQWMGPTRPQKPLPSIRSATFMSPSYWQSDPQVDSDKADTARVKVPQPEPGTPPEESLLAQVEKAAAEEQRDMCSMWPDNDNCGLLRGDEKTHAVWGPSLGANKDLRAAREKADVIAERLAWKLVLRDEALVLAAAGSSTSAGHDTLFNSTYVLAAGRRLRRSFAKVGVEVRARNVAMGGWDYRDGPMWCMAQMAGEDPDLVTWEWGMFGPEHCSLEVYARNVMSLPRRPVTMLLGNFGDGAPGGAFERHVRVPPGWETARKYISPFGRDPLKMVLPNCGDGGPLGAQEAAIRDNECFERESVRHGGMPYKDWLQRFSSSIVPSDRKAIEAKGLFYSEPHMDGGMHRHYHEHGHGVYTWTADITPSVDWKPWWLYRFHAFKVRHHCAWMSQTLAGHSLAYFLLDRLIAAVRIVRADLAKVGSMKGLSEFYRARRKAFRAKDLPPPQTCRRAAESAPGRPQPRCWTDFLPMHKGAPVALAPLIDSADNDTWVTRALGWQQTSASVRQYRDLKLVQRGQAWWEPADRGPPAAGWLRLTVPPAEHSQEIALCFFGKYLRNQMGAVRCRGNSTLIVLGAEHAVEGYQTSAAGQPLKHRKPPRGRFNNVHVSWGEHFARTPRVSLAGPDGKPAKPTVVPVYDCYAVCRSVAGEPTVVELRPEPVLSLTHVIAN